MRLFMIDLMGEGDRQGRSFANDVPLFSLGMGVAARVTWQQIGQLDRSETGRQATIS